MTTPATAHCKVASPSRAWQCPPDCRHARLQKTSQFTCKMRRLVQVFVCVLLLLSGRCCAWAPRPSSSASATRLWAQPPAPGTPPAGRDPRLLSEVAAPFRLLRLFVYGGTGAAGAIGTFTALPQLLFAVQDGGDAVGTALTNVGIDLAAMVGAVFLFDKERSIEAASVARLAERERRAVGKLPSAEVQAREAELALLPVEIIFSNNNENATRIVSLQDLQSKGGQNVIIVAGPTSFVKDAVLAARVEGTELFNTNNVYIVPVVLNAEQLADAEAAASKGFGSGSGSGGGAGSILSAPYIGRPTQMPVWERYLSGEIRVAEVQGAKNVAKEGLVLAVDKAGKVVRRGLGQPPWKSLVDELLASKGAKK